MAQMLKNRTSFRAISRLNVHIYICDDMFDFFFRINTPEVLSENHTTGFRFQFVGLWPAWGTNSPNLPPPLAYAQVYMYMHSGLRWCLEDAVHAHLLCQK